MTCFGENCRALHLPKPSKVSQKGLHEDKLQCYSMLQYNTIPGTIIKTTLYYKRNGTIIKTTNDNVKTVHQTSLLHIESNPDRLALLPMFSVLSNRATPFFFA